MLRCLTKTFLVAFFLIGIITIPRNSYAIVVASDINSNTHWTVAQSPIDVTDNSLVVAQGITLTIDPGVTVNFAGSVTVRGRLVAQGTSLNPIIFDEFNVGSGWGSLTFTRNGSDNTTSSINLMDYVSFNNMRTNIYLDRRSSTITNSTIDVSSTAQYAIHAYSNNGGTYPESTNIISDNIITLTTSSNSASVYGVHIDGANTTFTDNTVTMTYSGSGFYGFGFVAETTNTDEYDMTLEGNVFDITSTNTSKLHVYGIFIKDYDVTGDITDNTVIIDAPHEIHGIDSTGERNISSNTIDLTSSDATDTAEREVFGIYYPSVVSTSIVTDNDITVFSDSARYLYGIYAQYGSYTNNRITLESTDSSGILYGFYQSYYPGTIENNTVSLNANSSQTGYGIYFGTKFTDSTITAKNNILYNANGINFTGLYKIAGNPSDIDADYNLIYNFNTTYDGISAGTHDLTSNPDFADPTSFTLNTSSPAIDAGDWDSSFSNEPAPNGGKIDIGAHGNTSSATTSIPIVAPEITTNSGANFTNIDQTVTLAGRTSSATTDVLVNGSTTGVTYTDGETEWTYSGELSNGINAFSITSRNSSNNTSNPDTISVTWDDNVNPSVTEVYPEDGATGVPVTAVITATFSEAMSGSTITSSHFYITNKSGTVTYSGMTAELTPVDLDYYKTYTVHVTTGAADAGMNHMTAEYTWSFTTDEEQNSSSGTTIGSNGGNEESGTDTINSSSTGSGSCSLILFATTRKPKINFIMPAIGLLIVLYAINRIRLKTSLQIDLQ